MMNVEEECCNSGCNNCILDIRRMQRQKELQLNKSKKHNLFDGTYRTFVVISIQECTENVHRFRFEWKGDDPENYTIEVPPTQHLFLRAPSEMENAAKHDKDTKENYISRPYTPIAVDELTFDVLVKFESNGRMSEYLKSLKVGNVTEWKGSYGDFIWSPNQKKFLICICQGVAIAPMYLLVMSILANENDETIIHLFACFKNIRNCLLRDELMECRKYWNFNSEMFLSKNCDNCAGMCSCVSKRFDEIIHDRRLTTEELKKFYHERRTSSVFTLVCGTEQLERMVETCIDELNDGEIRKNYFCLK